MSEELLSTELLSTGLIGKKTIRYPLFAVGSEAPHRFFPILEIYRECMRVLLFVVALELFICVCIPGAEPSKILFACLVPVLFILTRLMLRTGRLRISEDGISFPLLLAPLLHGRLRRNWQDLDTVDLHAGKDDCNRVSGGVLSFTFKSGGRVDLETTRIARCELRALEEGLRNWAGRGTVAPAVSDMVARNDLELSDTASYIFAKTHRRLLSEDFGLTNQPTYQQGTSLFDGQYIVEKATAASGHRASYIVDDIAGGRILQMIEYDLSIIDPDMRSQCISELSDSASRYLNLQVQHVLNLTDFRCENERFSLFIEPLDSTLRSFVRKRGPLKEKALCSLASTLAEAAQSLSENGLALGGIRPDNISFQYNGTIMIGEFGFVDDLLLSFSNALFLDAPYAAPERIVGHETHSSDLYSIGAVMYFALTATDPECFGASAVHGLNKRVTPTVNDLISKLLDPDPDKRGTLPELIHALGGKVRTVTGADYVY